jgi:hypothetical protein
MTYLNEKPKMKGTNISQDLKYIEIIKRKENTKGLNMYHN